MALKLTQAYWARGNDAQLAGWFGRAHTLLQGEEETHEGGLLLWNRVKATQYGFDDASDPVALARELVELGRRLEDLDLEALGLLELGHGLILSGRVSEGSRLLDEANAIASCAGLHTAEATLRGGDYSGRGVHAAARVAAAAGAGEIVASRDTVAAAAGDCEVAAIRTVSLKGLTEPVELVTVRWS